MFYISENTTSISDESLVSSFINNSISNKKSVELNLIAFRHLGGPTHNSEEPTP
ncbi:hypothetical protein [Arachidicoccus sp.]|uniref:hypothetical protein n=1 Tax=Arachidicoccus sp. TaxID=1872624 RepID=UPI003D1F7EB5